MNEQARSNHRMLMAGVIILAEQPWCSPSPRSSQERADGMVLRRRRRWRRPWSDDEQIEQVFDGFAQAGGSDVVGSMGLGLNVSRTLADLMGADLVYERIGGETHFSLDLGPVDAPDVTRADH